MDHLTKLKDQLTERLPVLGLLAFSLCSVNSVAHLFTDHAQNPTRLLWFAAGLVEVVTAWIVHQVVDNGRKVTRSRISQQDRRFYGGALVAFVVLAIPSLFLSVWANTLEFGTIWLGIQFPLLSVACAVGSAVPIAVTRFERSKAKEAQERQAKRKQTQAIRKQTQAQSNVLSTLGKAGETLALFAGNPMLSQASAAQALSISRQAVGQHLRKLETLGLVTRDNGNVEVLVELPTNGK